MKVFVSKLIISSFDEINYNDNDFKGFEEIVIDELVFFGKIPVMVHSKFCSLSDLTFEELKEHHECPYDQVWWLLYNKRFRKNSNSLAYNYVDIFRHASPLTTLYSAEFRSSTECMSKVRTLNLKLVTTFAEEINSYTIYV
ncbi:8656_t:CDS:2 [Funneliformis geosporum]|nr:8656_t:CDS:2 [Funneliformis geosporum]